MSRPLTASLMCMALVACSSPPLQPVDAGMKAEVDAGKLPSVAYALVRDGRIVQEGAVGWADKEHGVMAAPDTPYPLASVSKPLVATAVMMLSERGRIDLQAPASRYVEGLPPSFSGSVRQLLNHTSGLPTYARIAWRGDGPGPQTLQPNLRAYAFAAQPPATVFEYSNLGYGMLGRIVETQGGASLGEFMRTQLFEPLGMRRTMLVDGFAVPAGSAAKYDAEGHRLSDTWNDTPGAGNVYASAHDLALFASFHLAADADSPSRVLSARSRRLMRSHVEPGARYDYYGGAHYGLGWYVRQNDAGEPVVWHEGGMPGVSSILMLLPQRGIAAVVLINATDANAKAQQVANSLIHAIEPSYQVSHFVATDGFTRYGDQPEWRGRWAGEIDVDGQAVPFTLRFEGEGRVHAEFADRGPGALLPAHTSLPVLVHGELAVGTLQGTLPAADVAQVPGGYVLLRLVRHGDELSGAVVAYASPEGLRHLLPFAARLRRQGEEAGHTAVRSSLQ